MKEIFEEVIKNFSPILRKKIVAKGEILHCEGQICKNLYLVSSGLLRAFYYLDKKDVTAHFAGEYGSVTAPDSFIKHKASRYNIEALEESNIYSVDNYNLELFLDKNPRLEKLARKFTQAIYIELLERIEKMTFLSAKDKYKTLLNDHPKIIQRANLGHIASYLGISGETLSRVRNSI